MESISKTPGVTNSSIKDEKTFEKSSKLKLFFILVFVVFTLALGSLILTKNIKPKNQEITQKYKSQIITPTPTILLPTTTPDPATSNWKTFISFNDYSFKYPQNWATTTESINSVEIWDNPEYIKLQSKLGPYKFQYQVNDYAVIRINMESYSYPFEFSNDIKKTVEHFKKKNGNNYLSVKAINVGGRQAIELTNERLVPRPGLSRHLQQCLPEDEPCLLKKGVTKQVLVNLTNFVLSISYDAGVDFNDIDKLGLIFDQLVSTFKFSDKSFDAYIKRTDASWPRKYEWGVADLKIYEVNPEDLGLDTNFLVEIPFNWNSKLLLDKKNLPKIGSINPWIGCTQEQEVISTDLANLNFLSERNKYPYMVIGGGILPSSYTLVDLAKLLDNQGFLIAPFPASKSVIPFKLISTENININSDVAIKRKFIIDYEKHGKLNDNKEYTQILIKGKKNSIQVGNKTNYFVVEAGQNIDEKILNHILSSFKYTISY